MANANLAFKCAQIIEQAGFCCVLVGGVAVGIWCEERFTKDLDFALAVKSDKQSEKVVKLMMSKGFQIDTILEHKPTGKLAVVILNSPKINQISYRVDLIFVQSGIEDEVVKHAMAFKVDKSNVIRVASVGHLIALKNLSMDDKRRPQDRIDLVNLLKVADRNDIRQARRATELIIKRGFDQKKDLNNNLNLLLQEYSGVGTAN